MSQEIYLKVCFNKKNRNKKIKIKKSIKIDQLKNKIKNALPQLNENYVIYCYNQDHAADITNEFQFYKFIVMQARDKVYVKDKEDQYSRQLNQSQYSLSFQKQSAIQSEVKLKPILPISKVIIHHVDCKECKSHTIIGIRWKSLTKLDYDLCSSCFQKLQESNKNEDYLKIDTQDYFRKVNYYPTICKLFDPQYKEETVKQDEQRRWISQQDILKLNPDAVGLIWKIASPLAIKINQHFDKWIRQYQAQSRR